MFVKILCVIAIVAVANAGYLASPLRYAAAPAFGYAAPAIGYTASYRAAPALALGYSPVRSFGYSGYAGTLGYGRSLGYAGGYGW